MNTRSVSFWLALIGIIFVILSLPQTVGFPYGLHCAVIFIGLSVIFLDK